MKEKNRGRDKECVCAFVKIAERQWKSLKPDLGNECSTLPLKKSDYQ